jgi:hypothetical protein
MNKSSWLVVARRALYAQLGADCRDLTSRYIALFFITDLLVCQQKICLRIIRLRPSAFA